MLVRGLKGNVGRNSFKLFAVGAALLGIGLGIAVYASTLATGDSLPVGSKATPQSLVVYSSASLPPEVKALEASTVGYLFDRDVFTLHVAYAASQVETTLDSVQEVRAIKVFGPAPYLLTVKAESGGAYQTISGLENLNLTKLTLAWNVFAASVPATTGKLLFELTPASGSSATGLQDLEIWTAAAPSNIKNGETLLAKLLDNSAPPQARLYAALNAGANPTVGVIGPSGSSADDPVDNSFSFSLEGEPSHFARAYLTYELTGAQHWMMARRSINGGATQGGNLWAAADTWALQVEKINPAWLKKGANTIAFSLPSGVTGNYTVRNVRVVAELDTGANVIEAITADQPDATGSNPLAAVMDGDLGTGWKPYPSDQPVGADAPTIEFEFVRPTQLDAFSFYLSAPIEGALQVSAKIAGQWVAFDAEQGAINTTGWNTIYVPDSVSLQARIIEGVRVKFPGSYVSSAEFREVLFIGSGVNINLALQPKLQRSARLDVTFPDAAQFYGRYAYVRGFVAPPDDGSGIASISVGGVAATHTDGGFGVLISKDAVIYNGQKIFAAQGDNEPWWVEVKATYKSGQVLTRNVDLSNQLEPAAPITGTVAAGTSAVVSTKGKKTISHDESKLVFDAGTVSADTTVTITPLADVDVPALDAGMVNVTKGPRRAYRFLPHGAKFLKNVNLTLPYDKALVPPGYTEDDIKTYYFDDQAGRWVALERVSVDKAGKLVNSLTNHFTDMINAVVTVPDHPEAVSFNPTSMKDIKAADPGSQVNLIDPPGANNVGDARLSYPIEVPPGRAGLQPSLAVQYNSSGGNGWMGLGWDLATQAISIDTRFGVPRYSGTQETETYTLNGEMLTPVAHRGEVQPRATSGQKTFYTRVEGQFRRIVRHGTAPDNFTWEVTDKNGTQYFYGRTAQSTAVDSGSILATNGASGNIFHWALTEIRDPNGNFVRHRYRRITDSGVTSGAVPGYQLYPDTITYTGHGTTEGLYQVRFLRDRDLNEARRSDVQIDARGGFKRVTADLLRQVEVSFNGALVRRYDFRYNDNPYGDKRPGTAFNKTLLTTIVQHGADGQEFNRHRFEYNDEARDTGGKYAVFDPVTSWIDFSDQSDLGSISGQQVSTIGGHMYVGVGVTASKLESSGDKKGYSVSNAKGAVDLVDVDGDALPDKVFESDRAYYYRRNLSGPVGSFAFSSTALKLPTLPGLLKEETVTRTYAAEHHGSAASVTRLDTFTRAQVVGSSYMVDANADGFTDVVVDGVVYYGYLNAQGQPAYTKDSNLTPAPVTTGTVTMNGIDQSLLDEYQQRIDQFPLVDTIRRWTAPFDGVVRIDGAVQLVEDTSDERKEYSTADGVRVAVQVENAEVWSQQIEKDQYGAFAPTGVDALTVHRGDRIYFRVQSRADGAYDHVLWNPQISYVGQPLDALDANGLSPYRYEAAADFVLAGRPSRITAPATGVLQLTGQFAKLAVTSDDVKVVVLKNGAPVFPAETVAWDAVRTIDFNQQIAVNLGDVITLSIQADSPVDLRQLMWTPRLVYVAMDGVSPGELVDPTTGESQAVVKAWYDIETYPVNASSTTAEPWNATKTGTVYIRPSLDIGVPGATSTVAFTVKRRGELVAKQIIVLEDGVVPVGTTIPVGVVQNDALYFDFGARDTSIDPGAVISSVAVTYDNPAQVAEPVYVAAPVAFRRAAVAGALPVPYRGWTVAAYNGNRQRAENPINQGELLYINNYTAATAPGWADTGTDFARAQKSYPMYANPVSGREGWDGPHEAIWVRPESMSSSRLGPSYIGLPSAGDGQVAVNRISRSSQYALTHQYGLGGLSYGRGDTKDDPTNHRPPYSESLLDYMDMNGDGLPDIVARNAVQYTLPTGAYQPADPSVPGFIVGTSDVVRGSTYSSNNVGTGATVPIGSSSMRGTVGAYVNAYRSLAGAAGTNAPTSSGGGGGQGAGSGSNNNAPKDSSGSGTDMPSLGFSVDASLGDGDSLVTVDSIDMNGDGLPDRVTTDGGSLRVGLNLGYGFAPTENWGNGLLGTSQSTNSSLGGGFSYADYGIAGGYTGSTAHSLSTQGLMDVNGDGLPDRVIPTEGGLQVYLNLGNGFAADSELWGGGTYDHNGIRGLGGSKSTSSAWGAFFSYSYQLCDCQYFQLYITFNPGSTKDTSLSRQEMTLKDIDGDGQPDQLRSTSGGNLQVARNRTGRTNLLNTVYRPLGARIDLEYARAGNTQEDPRSRWVLSKVTTDDGVHNDGADLQQASYRYENGRYDRREREFLGFGRVIEEYRDTTQNNAVYRSVIREFHTDSVYTKGLLALERRTDAAGQPLRETTHGYLLRDVLTGLKPADPASLTATIFPMHTRTDAHFYEYVPGSATTVKGKSTYTTHEYDGYGNVSRFTDAGDEGAQDDVDAQITYSGTDAACVTSHAVGIARSIEVKGAGSLMRRREAVIDCATAEVREVRQFLEGGAKAVTNLDYYPNGNLKTVTGPANETGQRYVLNYEYDPVVVSYVSRITDSFGLSSAAIHDYRFGKVLTTTDTNSQQTAYLYDTVGRVERIFGPYEPTTGRETIRFEYHHDAAVPYALTEHIDRDAAGNPKASGTIDTVLFIDGLKRVLQTKKDVTVLDGTAPRNAMTVSGRVKFDAFGRSTAQYYPLSPEPVGQQGVFNTAYDSVAPTVTVYDVLDRVTMTTLPDGSVTTLQYSFAADRNSLTQFETLVRDANANYTGPDARPGAVKATYRNVRDLITSVKELHRDPATGTDTPIWTAYAYDPLKQVVEVTDDQGNLTKVSYDHFGRRTSIDNPDTGKTEFVHDLASNLTKKITANLRASSQFIAYGYDFNRLKAITYPVNPGNNVTYTYGTPDLQGDGNGNRAGRLTKITSAMGTEERAYGKLGEVIEEKKTIPPLTGGATPPTYTTRYKYDTFGRLLRLTYPDGEVLTYAYDAGGNLKSAVGEKKGYRYPYLREISYDKFEQRLQVEYGNGVKSTYAYAPDTRRLATLTAGKNGVQLFQNLAYAYDRVGNVVRLANQTDVPARNDFGGPVTQGFTYDTLYRLTNAEGTFTGAQGAEEYRLALTYDSIHNIKRKDQDHDILGSQPKVATKTTYDWAYGYPNPGSPRPHAPGRIGQRLYSYDLNGNQLGWQSEVNGTTRTLLWDEENRLKALKEGNHTHAYVYDDQGQRTVKLTTGGETVYVNPWYTVRNGASATKHVFAGQTRLADKLVLQGASNPANIVLPIENNLYYYHPDHLGSTGYVTDRKGNLTEHVQYFPFGESWIEQRQGADRTPYLFTGKELDEETGLYYFGARYYDPRTSVWQSPDPIDRFNAESPTIGLNLYQYGLLNPIRYNDPQGLSEQESVFTKIENWFKDKFVEGAGDIDEGLKGQARGPGVGERAKAMREVLGITEDEVQANVDAQMAEERQRVEEAAKPFAESATNAAEAGIFTKVFGAIGGIAKEVKRGKVITQEAARHGFDRVVKDPPFNSHGQKVFTDGKNFLTRDVDSHSGGVWKMFDRHGSRIGTFDANLNKIGK